MFADNGLVVRRRAWFLAMLLVGPAVAQMPPTKVVVVEARVVETGSPITLVGTVAPVRRSQVASEVAGVIVDMPVWQGDRLKQGQVICRLNVDLTELRLAEAEARLAALKEIHRELLAGTREEELRRLEALAREAEARVTRWKFEKERVEKLYAGSDAGSVREVYDARAEYEMAVQRYHAAKAEYEMAQRGPRAEVIAKAANEIAEQQAVVDRIRREADKATIKAPFDGSVVSRVVEVGEWVSAGGKVIELVDLDPVLVRVNAPESMLPYIQVGDEASIRVEALGETLSGRVRHVIPQGSEQARTFPVEVEVSNPDGKLAAGMFARVTVAGGAKRKFVAVPKDAVVQRNGVDYVTLIVPGRGGEMMGMPTPVTTGLSVEEWITITSGNLAPGTQVATRGNERIAFPMPVIPVDAYGTPLPIGPAGPPASAPASISASPTESGKHENPDGAEAERKGGR